jgi:methionine transaminase
MIKSKLPGTGTSIFAVMSKMAQEYNALNLSQGFPDFNCSEELIDLVHHYQRKGFNQYAPMPGVPSLLKQISEKTHKLYGRYYSPINEIVITSGATQALFTAISTVINKGDLAIILEPAYDSYAPAVEANGGTPVFIKPLEGFRIDWNGVENKFNSKVKLLIINSPHNPSGTLICKEDIIRLEELSRKYSFIIISDEVYEHMTFDNQAHLSISSSEVLYKRAFVISSFGKTFHTTGWKVGYCCAPETMMSEFKKLHQFIVFAVNTPVQHAYAEYLKNEDHYLSLNSFYQAKRDIFLKSIEGSLFILKPSAGTYFQLLDYSGISSLPDTEFCEYLIKEKSIAAIPLSPFYSGNYNEKIIRICFAKKDEVLTKAGEILKQL